MIGLALNIAFAALALAALLCLYRLALGPGIVDRVLALDTLVINGIGLIVLMGIKWGGELSFEAALLFAMVGFVSTVAFCKFILRGNVIE
jgi:multicomponent K+:H+ antiporter subunit F